MTEPSRAPAVAVAGLLLALLLLGHGGRAIAQEARMTRPGTVADYDENAQPAKLPPRPSGMTLAMIREGDALFRGKGGCVTCHGPDAQGLPAMGSSLTAGLLFVPSEWEAIDSLITAGIPEPTSRTPIAMPPRGAASNLTPEETRKIAAYVWAISRAQGEPWPGGHRRHTDGIAVSPKSR